MTPPRDPPDSGSGKTRPPHRDWAGENTRPGAHVLPQPAEDFADEPTPIREFHRLEVRVANVEAVALEARLRIEQADVLPSTEWAKRVEERIGACEVEARAGADLAKAVASLKRRTWAAVAGSVGAVVAALWFALGVARAGGVKAGVEQEREIRRAADSARLDAVEAAAAKLREEIARILGQLDGARPYRAAPYLGPPPPQEP